MNEPKAGQTGQVIGKARDVRTSGRCSNRNDGEVGKQKIVGDRRNDDNVVGVKEMRRV